MLILVFFSIGVIIGLIVTLFEEVKFKKMNKQVELIETTLKKIDNASIDVLAERLTERKAAIDVRYRELSKAFVEYPNEPSMNSYSMLAQTIFSMNEHLRQEPSGTLRFEIKNVMIGSPSKGPRQLSKHRNPKKSVYAYCSGYSDPLYPLRQQSGEA